jgi:glutathione peroxidase
MDAERQGENVYGFSARRPDGSQQSLGEFEGRVLLVVNVATGCAFADQFADLEALWRRHADRGLSVLAFPCNQFGHQEPGTDAEIGATCALRWATSFPLYAKIEVNGPQAEPLFAYLQQRLPGVAGSRAIKWNFTKFLVDRRGRPVRRIAPLWPPRRIEAGIETLLDAPA